jgi:hypothetical protein
MAETKQSRIQSILEGDAHPIVFDLESRLTKQPIKFQQKTGKQVSNEL